MHSIGQGRKKLLKCALLLALLFTMGATAQANISVNPNPMNFGSQTMGVASPSMGVALTNNTSSNIKIVGVSLSLIQFVYSGPSLPMILQPGQSLLATVTFTATAAQAYQGTLTFTRANGLTVTGKLSALGIGPAQSPSVTTQPASQTITASQTATFSVAATGTAPLSYQWSKNGTAIGGAASPSYTTPAETTADNGAQFNVVVSNSAGSATSSLAGLTVTSASACVSGVRDTWENSSFLTQTSPFTATYSATPSQNAMDGVVGFTLNAANAYASLAAITRFNPSGAIDARNGGFYAADVSVPYTAGLQYNFRVVINPATEQYSVYVTPPGGSEIALASNYTFRSEQSSTTSLNSWAVYSEIGTVSVCNMTIGPGSIISATPPTITAQPASQTVIAGQTATFLVTATGTAPLSYQWSKNGTAISGATSASYTTPAETIADTGTQFTVVVSNSAGSATGNPATLTVNAIVVAPSITTQPSSQTIIAGQTATFSVSASGTAPMTYQWRKNGTAMSGATSASYTTPAETIADTGAQFTVVVSNSVGNTTSNAATLTVNPAPVAPSITTQPSSQTITASQTATFSVTASGTAPLSYQWSKNGTAISGAISSTYTTPAETASDTGAQFSVVVSNSAGTVTSNNAILTVTSATVAPSITTQPTSQTITASQTATFSVTATGTAPLSYQWSKNGTVIGGATSSSYTTPAETTADNGAPFTVVVSNSVGNATSNAATLTVNANTYLLSASVPSLNFGNTNVGNSSMLPVTLTNSGNSNVAVSSVSISGAGFTASGVSNGQIITPGQFGTLNVTFAPAATGSVSGSVVVSSNATNSPATVTLAGTGTQASSGADAPALFFTDLTNGPATGNTDPTYTSNGGAYVTLYGNFFGSTQGNSTVTLNGASCLHVVSWGQSWLWYQRIVVQLTSGCSTGNLVVTTSNGTSNSVPFTVGSGNIYYVSATGSDFASGSFSTPFRTMLHGVTTAGASAGNIVYIMNGYTDTSSDPRGWGNAVLNPDNSWCHGTQNAMNGLSAYPGATVVIGSLTGSLQAVRSVDNGSTSICPGYWTFANIKWQSGTDAVVISGDALSNTRAHYWRWVANDVTNPNSGSGEGATWESGQVENLFVYGNYFHDMNLAATSNLTQGVYPSTDTNHVDLGWNELYNAKGRTLMQTHSSPLSSGNGFADYDYKVHDNKFHNSAEECILIDTMDPSKGAVLVYNNVVWNCGQDLTATNGDNIRLSGSGDFNQSQGTGYGTWVEFFNNTVYCTDGAECSGSSYTDNNRNNAPALSQHNQLLLSSCTGPCVGAYGNVPYFLVSNGNWGAGGSFYCGNTDTPSTCPWARGSNNLVFGNGGPTYTNLYTGTINSDPKLVSPSTADFHLQTGSPAKGAGAASWNGASAPAYDIDGHLRANPPSVGAYE